MVTEPVLLGEHRDGVLTLTLNRPAVLNSITDEVLDALAARLREAADETLTRCVVITGSGRAFCAGQDLRSGLEDGTLDVRAHLRDHYHPALLALRELEKPVVAAINGVAAGAGLSLALACDLRVASETATFVNAFVRIGLVPDAGGSYFLPRLVGLSKAMELSMLGETVDAAAALRLGLINAVLPSAGFAAEAHAYAAKLAEGPRSLGIMKRLLAASLDSDLSSQLGREEDAQAAAAETADFIEGVSAFLEKRPARFRGS